MKTVLRRLRGILGSVVAWGSAWFAGGLVYYLVFGLIVTALRSRLDFWGTLDAWYGVFWFAGSTAVVGAITGGAFSAYIAANFRNRQLQDLSPIRFALGGGMVTILLRLLFVTTETLESARNLYGLGLDSLWPSLAVFGAAGAATGFVSLKLAQKALGPGGSEDELQPGTEKLLSQDLICLRLPPNHPRELRPESLQLVLRVPDLQEHGPDPLSVVGHARRVRAWINGLSTRDPHPRYLGPGTGPER